MVNYNFFSEGKFFLFIVIISFIKRTYSSSEVCECTIFNTKEDDNERQLLTNLRNHTLCGKRFQVATENQYEYHFVICGQVGESPNVTLEKRDTTQVGNNTPLGYKNITDIIGITGPGAWTLLTFYSPKNDSANNSSSNSSTPSPPTPSCQTHSSVMVVCDKNFPNGEFRFGYFDKENCHYIFELRTAALCDEKTGMSGFSVFLIILVVAFALYFICGVIYNRTQRGAKGIDQIPHRRLWFGLGNKIADCFSALCRCDQYCSEPEHLDTTSQYSGGYSPIGGEASGKPPGMTSQNYERDSQLISP